MADRPLRPSGSLPAQIGRYRIVERIGRGAMGVVYAAEDEVIGRPVALKVLMTDLESDPETRARFYREAQAAARLLHPNVITVFDAGEDQGRSFIAMQLLEGAPLGEYLRRDESIGLERKLDLMIQICEGLAAAHGQGIVHRDLKPNNLFVQTDGVLKILDFGVARVADSSMTAAGAMLGTPDYMAPEQARGTTVDARSDIFSTGAVFYFMLAGHKPFPGPDLPSVLRQLQFEEPAPLSAHAAPPELIALVMQALAKDPDQRPARVEELLAGLVRFRRQYQADTRRLVQAIHARLDALRGAISSRTEAGAALGLPADDEPTAALRGLEERVPPLASAATGVEAGLDRGRLAAVMQELEAHDEQLSASLAQLRGYLSQLGVGERALASGDARLALQHFESVGRACHACSRARELADSCRSLAVEQQARADRIAGLIASAHAAMVRQDWAAAVAAGRDVLTLVPDDEPVLSLIAEAERAIAHEERRAALARQRLVERAEQAIDQLQFDEAETAIAELDVAPAAADAVAGLRQRLAEQRADVEAAAVRRQLSADQIGTARSAFRRGRYIEALEQLQAFLATEPRAQEAARELQTLQRLHQDLTTAADLAHRRVDGLLQQAALLVARGALAEALPLAREALRMDPVNVDAVAMLDTILGRELEQRLALERKRDTDLRAELAEPLIAEARRALSHGYIGLAVEAARAAERMAPQRADVTELLQQLHREMAASDSTAIELSPLPRRGPPPAVAPQSPSPPQAETGVFAQVNHWAADLLRRRPAKG
jgi:serine/threonine-protein kinase